MINRKIVVLGMALVAGWNICAKSYRICLDRDYKTGDKYIYDVICTSTRDTVVKVKGRVVNKGSRSLNTILESTATVMAVDELQRPSKLKIIISKFAMSARGKSKNILPAGTEVIAELKNNKKVYLINNKPANDQIAKILDLFVTMSKAKYRDNDIFGTKDLKKLGDTWPVNTEKAAEDLSSAKLKVSPSSIKGVVKFARINKVEGKEFLDITARMTISDMPAPPFPPNMKVVKTGMTLEFGGEVPADADPRTMQPLISNGKMVIKIVSEGKLKPNLPISTLIITTTKNVKESKKFLK